MTAEDGAPRDGLLALAPWPQLGGLDDEDAEAEIGWVVDLVTAIRSVRAEMNIPPARTIPLDAGRRLAPTTSARAGRWARAHQAARPLLGDITFADAPAEGSVQLLVRGESRRCRSRASSTSRPSRRGSKRRSRKVEADIKRVDAKLGNRAFRRARARGGRRGGAREARGGGGRRARSSRRWSGSRAPPDVQQRMVCSKAIGTCPGSKSGASFVGVTSDGQSYAHARLLELRSHPPADRRPGQAGGHRPRHPGPAAARRRFSACWRSANSTSRRLSLASYTSADRRAATARSWRCRSRCRRFSATRCIYVRAGAGIRTPQDLRGKRVGTTQYGSTGLVFMRGMLAARLRGEGRGHALVHGRAQHASSSDRSFRSTCRRRSGSISCPTARRWRGMFAAGELDALLSLYIPEQFPRRRARTSRGCFRTSRRSSRTTTGAPGSFRSCIRWWCARMSTASIRGWRRASTGRSARRSDIAVDGLYDTDALHLSLPFLIDHVEETWRVFGKDFWAYGLEPNRPTLAAIGHYVHEQGLSPRDSCAGGAFRARRDMIDRAQRRAPTPAQGRGLT